MFSDSADSVSAERSTVFGNWHTVFGGDATVSFAADPFASGPFPASGSGAGISIELFTELAEFSALPATDCWRVLVMLFVSVRLYPVEEQGMIRRVRCCVSEVWMQNN